MNIWKISRILTIIIFFAGVMLDPEPMIISNFTAGALMGAFTFIGLFIGSIYMGALRIALKPKNLEFMYPTFSSSPFDKQVLWQFEHFAIFLFLVASVTPFLRTDVVSALSTSLTPLGASLGLYLGLKFLVAKNRNKFKTDFA